MRFISTLFSTRVLRLFVALKLMIECVFVVLGSEEFRFASGLMALAVHLVSPSPAELSSSKPTLRTPSPAHHHHHPLTSLVLMKRVQLKW